MRRQTVVYQVPEINISPPTEPEPEPRPPRLGGWGLAASGLAILFAGFQLSPVGPTTATSVANLPQPAPVSTSLPNASVSADVSEAEFTWIEISGLERFETVTAPIETDDGYLTIGNPIGVSRAASVVISHDGVRWNRMGTIHGIGGEVNIVDFEIFQGQLFALGTYTETMPTSDFEPRHQTPAVWKSEDGIAWEMTTLDGPGRESFEPWNLWAGTEGLLASGWTPSNLRAIEAYRSLPAELRHEVGTGHFRIHTDQPGQVLVTAGPVVVLVEDTVDTPPAPNVMHVHRTADGRSWERLNDDTMGSGFINLMARSFADGESPALFHQWPAEAPDQLPQLVGNYLLGVNDETLRVFDLRGEEMGSWPLDQGPVEGRFDSNARSVTITTAEGQGFVFPVDDLAAYGEFLPVPQSSLALSEGGNTWRVAVPVPGLVTLVGPLGPGYLLQSRSQAVDGLWPAVYRYALVVP